MEQARIKYDAYRGDIERLSVSYSTSSSPHPSTPGDGGVSRVTVDEAVAGTNDDNSSIRIKFETSRDAYYKMKADTDTKLSLLNENKASFV